MEHASSRVNDPVPAERLGVRCIDLDIFSRESSDGQLDGTPEKQQWHDTSSESLGSLGSSENVDAAGAFVVDFVALLQVTRPEVLRAVLAFQVLRRFGQVFRGTWRPEQLYKLSRQAESIDEFWSHSWQCSVYWKIWFFLMMKNGLAACLVGSLLAAVMAFLSVMQYLPAWSTKPLRETKGFDGEYLFSPWALLSGNLASLLTLLLWRPKARVFVDRACIHQGDADLKLEGLLNIAAIIKQSRSLIVLWDPTYATRAWCSFELAAFLKSHEEGRHSRLVIKPAIIAPFTLIYVVGYSCLCLGETVLPTRGLFFFRIVYLLPIGFNYYFMQKYLQHIVEAEKQLKTFCWANTQCYCCSVNHLDSQGNQLICDKAILSECIQKWFGSIEDFDDLVRRDVRKAFAQQVMRVPFGYLWLVGAGSWMWWFQLDIAISRGSLEYFFTYLSTAPCWVFWICPASVIFVLWLPRRTLKGQILSFMIYLVLVILTHVYNNLCWIVFPNELLGRGVFAVTTLPISLAAICLFARFRDV